MHDYFLGQNLPENRQKYLKQTFPNICPHCWGLGVARQCYFEDFLEQYCDHCLGDDICPLTGELLSPSEAEAYEPPKKVVLFVINKEYRHHYRSFGLSEYNSRRYQTLNMILSGMYREYYDQYRLF